jgi:hypothetical protein
VVCAGLAGLSSGSMYVPVHYAEVEGLEYAISFGLGAGGVTTVILIMYCACRGVRNSLTGASESCAPKLHWSATSGPGLLAGLLWSIGNISTIFAAQKLGQALGATLANASLLVAGLWSILYYKVHAAIVHSLCKHHTLTIHSPYTHYTLTIHSPYTHDTITIHSLHTHYTLAIHSPYAHHILTIYSSYTRHTVDAKRRSTIHTG